MSEQPIASDQGGKAFRIWFLSCVGIANAIALVAAIKDGGIGSIGIVLVWGPMMNLAFALSGAIAWFAVRRASPAAAIGRHFSTVIAAPLLAAIAVFIANIVVGSLLRAL